MAVTSLVDSKSVEPFLKESQDIANSFLDLYLNKQDDNVVAMSPQLPSPVGEAPKDDKAMRIARRLRQIGDEFDAKVNKELREATQELLSSQTVFEIEFSQFRNVCNRVLLRCSTSLRSGWEQMGVIFTGMGQLVRELRQQNPQDESQRERQFRRFAGQYMQDIHLDQWIDHQGGMATIENALQDPTHPTVNVEGTSVD